MPKFFSFTKEKSFLVRMCDLVITASIALVFFALPLFFTGLVSQGVVFEKVMLFYLLVLLGFVAWITKGVAEGELKIIRTPLDLPLAALIIILLISSIFSVDKLASFIGSYGSTTKSFIAFVIYIAFYYLMVNNINYRRIKVFFWSMLLGAIITAVYSVLQISGIFLLPFAVTHAIAFNSIGSSSSLGAYIASILPLLALAIPFAIKEGKRSIVKKSFAAAWIAIVGAAVLVSLFLLFLLNNFVFLPAAIIGMVVFLMFVMSKIVRLRASDSAVPIVLFLALIIFLIGGNFNLVNPELPTEVSLSRNLSWQIAKSSLKHDPLFGSGPATFDYSFVKYRGTDFNASNLWDVRFDSASGSIFEMFATIGVLGTSCLAIIGLIFLSVAFIALSRSENKEIKIFLLGIFSSLLILTINASLITVSGSIILIIVALGALASALIIIDYPEKFKELKLSFRSSPKYALALAALFLLVSAGVVVLFTSGFKIYLADFYASKALSADSEQAIKYLNRAIATADYQDEYYLRLSRLYIKMANQEAQKGASANIAAIQNYLSSAILAGKKAADLSPNSVANKESLALIYENAAAYNISGALEWAEKLYAEVIQLEPDSPSAYVRLALINMAHANNEKADEEKKYFYNEAIKFYNQAIAKKSNFSPAYYGAAIAYEKLNDYDKAIEETGKAVTLAGDNLDYRFELGRMYFNRGVQSQNLRQQTKEITAADNNENLSVNQEQSSKAVSFNNDLKVAEAILKNLIEVSPSHANAIYSLALIYETVGDAAQARQYYEKLLNIVSDQPTKDAILKKLQAL
ncbi:hypothetical protein COU00_01615 [Candidatus Falkowbacteria bacterium CG10_big_fil_rev_8_21_14_0_10_43_11]|uniref:Uncharacterized protein n=1 Tax=Candidatus Falkowbacteria bacterium CG10_big_fil_rev_8_21_14_0_10_43_11 TaxID=1974568 RepID=A0A2M6WMF3_9BACT|nr:MAG: hypothetical protein COU00_01615 [Candidatus Falkowbacteria bacterium CG10_big_fil_rev_8_21_14_0_10_43_11]